MSTKRINWVSVGRPRDSNNVHYREYKNAKRLFRRVHRQVVESYCLKIHEDIDKLAEIDSGLFWREINKRRKQSTSDPGIEINFDGNIVRDPQLIANEWGNYFKQLYTPDSNVYDDSPFENELRNEIRSAINQTSSNECDTMTPIEIKELLNECKKGKACGEDYIFYEHITYGGQFILQALATLYSAMYSLSHTPDEMKRGVIITLHKGGRKRKDDPNNYRAITLSSVILKLYERILLHRLEASLHLSEKLDKQQGGFQKQIGCVMTSFCVKEAISFCKENRSKL